MDIVDDHPDGSVEFDVLFSQGTNEFQVYSKNCGENYKSRADKRKERVSKLRGCLEDPLLKKLKKQEIRQSKKEKLHQVISKMTSEEARTYLDQLKTASREAKQRVRSAMHDGQMFLLDLVYETKMNEKENRSLAKQVELIMRVIKYYQNPPSVHLCNFDGAVKQQMEKMGYQHWAVSVHSEDVTEVAFNAHKKMVYLSPDAELQLQSVEKDTAYILGGLVDRTVQKDASFRRAKELGIEARRLPIANFMKGRLCLNLDHVVNLVCKFSQCGNWKQAFNFAAPLRWKRQDVEVVKHQPKRQSQILECNQEPEQISQVANKIPENEKQSSLIVVADFESQDRR